VKVLQEEAPDVQVVALPDNAGCLEAVRTGAVDAYVIDEAILLNALATSDDFAIVGEPFGPVDYYGIGVDKDADAVGFIDEFLRQIEADGSWAELWQVTIGEPTGLTEVPTPPTVGQTTQ
jgi:ABC-type amino acid transport substrate-binding protein